MLRVRAILFPLTFTPVAAAVEHVVRYIFQTPNLLLQTIPLMLLSVPLVAAALPAGQGAMGRLVETPRYTPLQWVILQRHTAVGRVSTARHPPWLLVVMAGVFSLLGLHLP